MLGTIQCTKYDSASFACTGTRRVSQRAARISWATLRCNKNRNQRLQSGHTLSLKHQNYAFRTSLFIKCYIDGLSLRQTLLLAGVNYNIIYDKQDHQGKAAFNKPSPRPTKKQEPVARSPGGPQTKTEKGTRQSTGSGWLIFVLKGSFSQEYQRTKIKRGSWNWRILVWSQGKIPQRQSQQRIEGNIILRHI
jgi:hypothetical protein